MNKRITLRDIAQKVGVSHVTVSLALRGSTEVSLKRREEICKIAEEMGYRPDPVLNALNFYRHSKERQTDIGTIAFVHNWPTDDFRSLKIELFTQYYEGAVKQAKELGYNTQEFSLSTSNMTPKRLHSIILNRGIQGVIIPPMRDAGDTIDWDWSKLSCVAMGLSMTNPPIHRVANFHSYSMSLCVEKLVEKGHRKIGLVLSAQQDQRSENAYTGAYLSSIFRLTAEPPRVFMFPSPQDKDFKGFLKWFKREKLEALIVLNTSYASILLENGIAIPDEVSVASPHLLATEESEPRIQSTDIAHSLEDGYNIGATATRVLIRMLNQYETGIPSPQISAFIRGTWVDGRTIAKRRNK